MKNDKRKKNIRWTKNHRGEDVLELSVHWKDGKRYRRYMPNLTLANQTLTRIKAANLDGTWPELRKQLSAGDATPEVGSSPEPGDLSIEEATRVYYEEWCLSRHDSPEFDQKQIRTIVRILGERRLLDFTRNDANYYYKTRLDEVTVSSANHGLTVLSAMLKWATKEKKWIPDHPMAGFEWLKVDRKERFPLEDIDVYRMVERAIEIDNVAGRCIGILTETGLRISEALKLKRSLFEIRNRKVFVAPSKKNPKGRHVPLSPEAIEFARGLPVLVGNPYLFVRPELGRRLSRDRLIDVMEAARLQVGISFPVRPHDLRHFRALAWLESGAGNGGELNKVREWMGHKNIATTQIYLNYVEHRATASFDQMNRLEKQRLAARLAEELGRTGEKVEAE